jgi:hypothetical protein
MFDEWTQKPVILHIPPEEAQRMMTELFNSGRYYNWRNDPSYFWNRKAKK